jgi:hypothetical protein
MWQSLLGEELTSFAHQQQFNAHGVIDTHFPPSGLFRRFRAHASLHETFM